MRFGAAHYQPRCLYSSRPVKSKAASGRCPTMRRAARASGPSCAALCAPRRVRVVRQRRPRRAEVVLEGDQTRLIEVRAPQVQFLDPLRLRLLDRAPEEERHAAQRVVPGVRPAVLVDHRLLERQRQDARDGQAVLARHVDGQPVAQARNQVAEPGERLRRQAVPAPRQPQQAVETREQPFRRPGLVAQALALGPPDGPLGAGVVEAVEDLLRGPREIQGVQAVAGAFRKAAERRRIEAAVRANSSASSPSRASGTRASRTGPPADRRAGRSDPRRGATPAAATARS